MRTGLELYVQQSGKPHQEGSNYEKNFKQLINELIVQSRKEQSRQSKLQESRPEVDL